MKSTEIKFKFHLRHTDKTTHEHNLSEINNIILEFTEDITPLQYTGVKDKYGIEVYHKDKVRMFGIIKTVEKKHGAFGYYLDEKDKKDFVSFAENKKFNFKNNSSRNIEIIK